MRQSANAIGIRSATSDGMAPNLPGRRELPSALGIDVRHTDREVILARKDLSTADLKVSNVQAGHFTTNCVIPTRIGTITIKRGWVSADIKIRGTRVRVVSTHLDGDCPDPAIQTAQSMELLQAAGATNLPLVFIGDFNSDPITGSTAAYGTLTAAGFTDAWGVAGVGPGFTCCQESFLLNPGSTLSRRIDLVLVRGDFAVLGIDVAGDESSDRTPSGLWPSDHAGVVATLRLPDPDDVVR